PSNPSPLVCCITIWRTIGTLKRRCLRFRTSRSATARFFSPSRWNMPTTVNDSVHPAATIFPMMDDERLRELAEDIKQNGQREPIVYWKDQLLDGRNRLKACEL